MTDIKNAIAEQSKQPRVTFFLGASMALGWEVGYDDLFTLAEHTRSLVECFDVLEEMKRASPHRRVAAALIFLGERRDREAAAKKVLRVVKP